MQCVIARRCTSRAAGTFEYLVGWKGYSVVGDTWEPESHLPRSNCELVAAYDRKYDIYIEVVLATLRERFHTILQESKQGKFGSFFYLQIDPAVAERLLRALVKVAAQRSGVAPPPRRWSISRTTRRRSSCWSSPRSLNLQMW